MTGREEHPEWSNVDIVKPTRHSIRLLRSINGFETLAWSKQCYLETSEKYSAPMVPRNLVRFELTNPIGAPFSPPSQYFRVRIPKYTHPFVHFFISRTLPTSLNQRKADSSSV